METRKYADMLTGNQASEEAKSWFAHCQETCIPYVVMKSEGNFASVTWDSIVWPKEYNGTLDLKTGFLETEFLSLLQQFSLGNPKARVVFDNRAATFHDIEVRAAWLLAEKLYDLLLPISSEARDRHRPERLF